MPDSKTLVKAYSIWPDKEAFNKDVIQKNCKDYDMKI